jgi:hypothetical protein
MTVNLSLSPESSCIRFVIPNSKKRNLFRFCAVFAPRLGDPGGKRGNGVLLLLKQRRFGLELAANGDDVFRLRVVALLEIGCLGGEGCKVSLKLLFIMVFSGELLRLGSICELPLVDFGGEGGDCGILLFKQGLVGLE